MARPGICPLSGIVSTRPGPKSPERGVLASEDFWSVTWPECLCNALVAGLLVLPFIMVPNALAAQAGQAGAEPASQAAAVPAVSIGGYVQAVGVLFFLLACLWLAVWVLRRSGRFSFMPRPGSLPKDALVMEAQLPVGPRKGLMVVRFLNKRLLLGVTENRITLLSEVKTDHERYEPDYSGGSHHPDVSGESDTPDFSGILQKESGKQAGKAS